MKKLLIALSLFTAFSSFGQGTSMRSLNGRGTNTTLYNGLTLDPTNSAPALTGITNIGPFYLFTVGDGVTAVGRISLDQTATSSGDTIIADGSGQARISLLQNGGGSGNSFFRDANNIIRISFGQNGAGSGDFAVRDAANNLQLIINASGITGNGQGVTNVYEKNISVLTNTWGNATVDFSLGTQLRTNLAGNLTITGCANMNASNVNWMEILMDANGGTRTLVVPGEWYVAGFFTNGTTAAITNGTIAKLRVQAWSGVNTNASLEIYQ